VDRRTKEQVVEELHEKLRDLQLAILANYSGLDVKKMTDLRNALRKTNTEIKVVKNTLLRIASRETELGVLDTHFKGPLALILNHGKDVVEPAKVLIEFAKKNAELEIKAGVLNGQLLNKNQVTALAELPSREVLLAKLLSLLVGIQTSLVNVLSGAPRSFIQVLDAYRIKKETGN
jgi:large subunit ribosomal protein L10